MKKSLMSDVFSRNMEEGKGYCEHCGKRTNMNIEGKMGTCKKCGTVKTFGGWVEL